MTPGFWKANIYVPCFPQRYVMCVLATTGTMVSWMVYYSSYRSYKELMFNTQTTAEGVTDRTKELPWTTFRSNVIELFWVSRALSEVVGGFMMDVTGPKGVWALGDVITALASATLFYLSRLNPFLILCAVAATGVGFGMTCPGQSVVVTHWVPENQRTSFVALIESGLFLGVMAVVVLHDYLNVWEFAWKTWVYVSCVLTLLWVLVWCILFSNRPSEHAHISPGELRYLVKTTVGVKSRQTVVTVTRRNNTPLTMIISPDAIFPYVPWKEILLSPPHLSLQLLNLGQGWTQSLLLYQLNRYVTHMYSISSGTFPGVYLPALTIGIAFMSVILHGWVSDQLITRRLTSRTVNRRGFLSLSSYVSAGLLFAIPFLDSSKHLVLFVFYTLIHFQGVSYASLKANVVDLAPNYSGLLRGFLSAGTSLTYLLSREFVDAMVKNVSDKASWNRVFHTSAAILLIFSTPYLFFGSGEIQKWNNFTKQNPQDGSDETSESNDESS